MYHYESFDIYKDRKSHEESNHCQSNLLQILAVNGKDLIEWTGLRGGRWTGEWIGKIEQAVLHGICENNPTNIKEWFLDEFKREK